MYIFISYSSKDKTFARQLADSIAFYGVPYFLDEREIKVGENITVKVYSALERATHVIYVISKNSIKSKWVEEELSVAKMRQLKNQGCLILPLLIDQVNPPSSVTHIKYADFRKWKVKEFYFEALQELLMALGITAQYATSTELAFFLRHLSEVGQIKETADTLAQVYFQLERIWFSALKKDPFDLSWWFYETVTKTLAISEFDTACRVLNEEMGNISQSGERSQQILELCKVIRDDYTFFNGSTSDNPQVVYKRLGAAEKNAYNLSSLIASTLLELQNMIV